MPLPMTMTLLTMPLVAPLGDDQGTCHGSPARAALDARGSVGGGARVHTTGFLLSTRTVIQRVEDDMVRRMGTWPNFGLSE